MNKFSIEVNNVSKIFGSNTAVNCINLQIEEGEFFSFLGPSGCGKTTLLRMIAGFEKPSSGQILISGQDMSQVPPHKRPVNMVFQNYALFPHLSVADNVCFGLRSKGGMSKSEMLEKAKEALSLVRLAHLADRYPSQMSGGQQQRVALARAVVNRPRVLLLDEPLSALDPQIRDEMQDELAQLQRELKMTFIMVTHDQSEALALSNRIAVFCAGNLEQVGTPQAIYQEPKTKFVAKFIGNTNLLPGHFLEKQGDLARIQLTAQESILTSCNREHQVVASGAPVMVWVKPQFIHLAPADTESSQPNSFSAVILNRSYLGTSTEYLVRVLDAFDVHSYVPNRESGAEQFHFAVGDRVSVKIPAELCSFLPVEHDAAALCQAGAEGAPAVAKSGVISATT